MIRLFRNLVALPMEIKAALAILAGVIVGGIAAALWLRAHDRRVINDHEAAISAQVGAATQAANDVANANDAARQVEDAKAAVLTEEALRHAQEEHPEEVRRASGPAVRAVTDQLRKRATASRTPAR